MYLHNVTIDGEDNRYISHNYFYSEKSNHRLTNEYLKENSVIIEKDEPVFWFWEYKVVI